MFAVTIRRLSICSWRRIAPRLGETQTLRRHLDGVPEAIGLQREIREVVVGDQRVSGEVLFKGELRPRSRIAVLS